MSASRAAASSLALVDDCLFLLCAAPAIRQALKDDDDATVRARRIEEGLARAVGTEWNARAKDAIRDAVAALPPAGTVDVEPVLIALNGRFAGIADSVQPIVDRQLRAAYDLGRAGAASQGGIGVDWTLVDRYAQGWLVRDTAYWVGEQQEQIIGSTVADVVRGVVVDQGLSRAEAAALLAEKLAPLVEGERPQSYWDVVSAAGVTRSRNFGVVESFVEAGITVYEIVNPMDEATSEICAYLNGKTFEVASAVSQRDAVLLAASPQDVKDIAPWLPAGDVIDKSDADLQAAGIALPPYHGNCRSSVVIAGVKALGAIRGFATKAPASLFPESTQKVRRLAAQAMTGDELRVFLARPIPTAATRKAVRLAERQIVSAELRRRGEPTE